MKKKLYVIGLIVGFSIAISSTAFAYSYATSYLNIFNGTLIAGDINEMLLTEQNVTSADGASLNGTGPTFSVTALGPVDATVANAPGSDYLRTENDYTLIGDSDPNANYSGADSWTPTVQTIDNAVPPNILTTVQSLAIAEGQVDGGNQAESRGNNSSSTILAVQIENTAPANTLAFDFDATTFLRTVVTADEALGSKAEAIVETSVVITDAATGAEVFRWTPDGVLGGGIIGGIETSDAFTLNTSRVALGLNAPIGFDLTYDPTFAGAAAVGTVGDPPIPTLFGNFSAVTNPFGPGVYFLTLQGAVRQSVIGTAVIPEPSTMLLLGAGLVGLAVVTRRRKN